MAQTQRVLVVPSSEFDRLGRFQGFSPDAERYLNALLSPEHAHFAPRSEVEEDPSLKQLIPYVIFRSGDLIFTYTRGKSGGESRLKAKRSIGVGGHVDEEDAGGRSGFDAYETALKRELDEEVATEQPGVMKLVGLINDDSTPVGQVHLGVVHICDLPTPGVTSREDALADAGFVPLSELLAEIESFETWSQICLQAFLTR